MTLTRVRGRDLRKGETIQIDDVAYHVIRDAYPLMDNRRYCGHFITAEWVASDGVEVFGPVEVQPAKRYRVTVRP